MSSTDNSPLDLQGVNLYLIGMMGAGKTATGHLLAEALGYHFFDTDTLIEQLTGQSIPQIFAEAGEAEFRRLETQVLAELSTYKNLAIATGGGIVLNPLNWSYLQHGIVVWLDVPLAELWERLQGDRHRPLLQTPDPLNRLETLLQQRQPFYAQADLQIPVTAGATPTEVAQRVLAAIPEILKVHFSPTNPAPWN